MSVTFLNDTVGVPVRETAGASSLARGANTLVNPGCSVGSAGSAAVTT